ncbi:hypothetical protein [Clostridium sp. VAP52]|uniref:hypothetical protein n=1 Tax=Clostridium sp. VAP52 TaxID=2949977 RepID=UPI0020796CA6|nr:hypothetical protein [Clostridium sp. VAP52]
MLKDYVDFVGTGQCGGNITQELEHYKNQAFYINSSLDDLDTIETDYNKKYCIENVKGMAKDIVYANEVITSNENDEKIAEQIYKSNPNAHIYFFIFGISGGTGGAMTIPIMRKFKEWYGDKIVNAIVVKPHEDEDMINHYNAKICLEGIKQCMDEGIVTNLQILDNNTKEFGEKMAINEEFADLFDEILSFSKISKEGNLDEEELERIFSTEGITVIHKFKSGDISDSLNNFDEETIYAKFNKNPKIHGLILNSKQNNSINRSLIKEVFGVPMVTHDTTWDEDYNILISTGMTFNDNIITELNKNYNTLLEKKKEIENGIDKEEIEEIKIDDSILKSLNKTRAKTTERVTETRGRRGRSVGVKSETRYRR